MNDRFKFRVWDNKEEIYIEELDIVRLTQYGAFVFNNAENNTEPELNPKRFIFEQSTGLKDKNGNLIYENDVVAVPYIDPIFYQPVNMEINDDKAVVEYFKGCFVVNYPERTRKYLYDYENMAEVIGNIHENPELLEQSNDD